MDEQLDNTSPYPIHKKDIQDRIIYTQWSLSKRTVIKYWGNTINPKIVYRLYHDDATIDAYDKKGKTIISYSGGVCEINFPFLQVNKRGNILFSVPHDKVIFWKQKVISS